MNQIEVMGMILVAGPMGEYDRRVEILTKERGRISAFAKGARRPNSHLVGATAPFVFGKFTLYAGRNSYTLLHADVDNYFSELRQDMEAAYYGFYFLELATYYTREGNDETEMLKLLYQTFRVLTKRTIPLPLVRSIFELKTMVIEGESPQVFGCVNCAKEEQEESYVFSSVNGGVLCRNCINEGIDNVRISEVCLYSMQFIISTEIKSLYTFAVKDEVLNELQKVMKHYISARIDKKFKSLEIIEELFDN